MIVTYDENNMLITNKYMKPCCLLSFFLVSCLHHCGSFLIPRSPTKNIFLDGPFKPVSVEKSIVCDIEGYIPVSVEHSIFTRIGPNPKFEPEGGYHLFDGDGVTHWVRFHRDREGVLKAMYHNRYIKTLKLKAEEKAGRSLFIKVGDFAKPFALLKIMYSEFLQHIGVIPCIPKSHLSVANTNLVRHASNTMALCESGLPYSVEFSDTGLDTIGVESFGGFLHDSFTAHPKINPVDNKMYGFGSDGSRVITMYVFGSDGSPETKFPVKFNKPVLMHDFAITSEHILLLDMPLVYNMNLLCKGKIPVEFDNGYSSRIGVLDNDDTTGSSIRWFEVPGEPFMVSHVVNAYCESGKITLVSCDMESMSLNDVCASISIIHRTVIDLGTGCVSREPVLTDVNKSLDFPVINKSKTGSKNKFAYVTEFKHGIPGDICKVDLEEDRIVASISVEPGECTGECSFVPCGIEEDDGYILSFVTKGDASTLKVWSARDLSPVSSVNIPSRIPLGFHANTLY